MYTRVQLEYKSQIRFAPSKVTTDENRGAPKDVVAKNEKKKRSYINLMSSFHPETNKYSL